MLSGINSVMRCFPVITLMLILNACGGGGGGGTSSGGTGGGTGSPPPSSDGLSVSATTLDFAAYQGAALPVGQDVQVTVTNPQAVLAGAAYPDGTTPAPWLTIQATGSGSNYTFRFAVNNTSLSPGNYSTVVSIGISDSAGTILAYRNITVNYTVSLRLTASPGLISFVAEQGAPLPTRNVSVTGVGLNWTATADSWITLSSASGVAPSTVIIGINPAGLASGNYSGMVTFTRTGTSETAVVNVSLNYSVPAHRLMVSQTGVAFASTPALSKLTTTVQVNDNLGLPTVWAATSNQGWLAVTSSGTTPASLILTANPGSLLTNTVHYATVTITSSDSTVQNTETISVGLWIGSSTPATSSTVNAAYTTLVADPIRPYVYTHNGGADIAVYNVYTGSIATTLLSIATSLGNMTISPDGAFLYVNDIANSRVIPINLASFTAITTWPTLSVNNAYLSYIRSNNKGLILAGNGRIIDVTTGQALLTGFAAGLGAGSPNSSDILAGSQDGTRFCHTAPGVSPVTVICHKFYYSYFNGGNAFIGAGISSAPNGGGNATDLAMNFDGSRVYLAAGGIYQFNAYDTNTAQATMPVVFSMGANPFPNAIEAGMDGSIYGGASAADGSYDVWKYTSAGTFNAGYYVSGNTYELLNRGLAISGDGLRMITISDDPSLRFTTVGP